MQFIGVPELQLVSFFSVRLTEFAEVRTSCPHHDAVNLKPEFYKPCCINHFVVVIVTGLQADCRYSEFNV